MALLGMYAFVPFPLNSPTLFTTWADSSSMPSVLSLHKPRDCSPCSFNASICQIRAPCTRMLTYIVQSMLTGRPGGDRLLHCTFDAVCFEGSFFGVDYTLTRRKIASGAAVHVQQNRTYNSISRQKLWRHWKAAAKQCSFVMVNWRVFGDFHA